MIVRTLPSGYCPPLPSEITPRALYQTRRQWMASAGAGAAWLGGAVPAAWANRAPGGAATLSAVPSAVAGARTDERITPYKDATTYNNFYEFGMDKSDPARHAHRMKTQPWAVTIDGLVRKPGVWDLQDLLKRAPLEERIYRLRCVEGWSMVIPWVGYSLSHLIEAVEPLGSAKFIEFYTLVDPQTMPGVRARILQWPYVEGLRMDEARHPLTLLTVGMYGEVLPPQNGAPVRVVVPWKYGFKSGKSIVRIRFVEAQPMTSWVRSAPDEYGFYSNVNPQVHHPRWSQATERRIGEGGLSSRRHPTQLFNGYEPQVGQLYAGMDLRRQF
jgi:methionine sulfoxide reductase catalytic subunit